MKKSICMILAAVSAVTVANAVDSILWDLNNDSPIDASVSDFVNGGVLEDISGGTVQHVLALGNATMTDANGVTLSYVSGSARGPYTNPNTTDALIHEDLVLKNTTADMQIGGLTSFLKADTLYRLYLWGVGDNTGQSSVFTFNGLTIALDNTIDPDSNGASNFVANFSFTTDSTVSDTLDFHWAEQDTYGGFNAFAIVEDDGSSPPPGDYPPSTPSGVYTVISNMAVEVKWDVSGTPVITNYVMRSSVSGSGYSTIGSTTNTVYVDTTVATNETYYYVVSASNHVGGSANSAEVTGVGLPYDIIGANTSYGDETLDKDNLFDNDIVTFFDTGSPNGGWVGLDYGENNAQQIVNIEYVLRDWSSSVARSTDATFEGSNDPDFLTGVEVLYTVPATVAAYPAVNSATVANTSSFRYIRLKARSDRPLYSFAEVDFITAENVTAEGTPNEWLDLYYDVSGANPSNFADYAEADYSDTDGDGLLAHQEYDMGGDPTDANSPVGVNNLYAWPEGAHQNVVRWDESLIADTDTGGGYIVYRSLDDTTYTPVGTVATNEYTDSAVADGVIYYYKASATNASLQYESALSASEFAKVNPYDIVGIMNNTGAPKTLWFYELFDGLLNTYCDDYVVGGYAGLDYGAGNGQEILQVAFRLRNDSWGNTAETLVIDGVTNNVTRSQLRIYENTFEGSNDGTTWTTIATIDNIPEMVEWNYITVSDTGPYQHVRYNINNGWQNAVTADIEFLTASDYTANGTPILWLEQYGLTAADDEVDNDGDGMLSWEENIASTRPNDDTSVLELNSFSNTVNGFILNWQSVEGKSYSIITNTSLTVGTPGTAVSGITGLAGETSYTTTVSGASTVFYEIGVE